MANQSYSVMHGAERAVATNKVLKNTYLLLSGTLAFSAVMAVVSMALQVPSWMYLVSVIAAMVMGMFVLPRTANSSKGIGVIFAITGLLGFGLGSILSMYLALPRGPEIIATAFGGTGIIFLGLSGYALTSKRDFSFLGGFVFAGMMVVVVAMLANIFLAMPALALAISACHHPAHERVHPVRHQPHHQRRGDELHHWRPTACISASSTSSSACCRSWASWATNSATLSG